jgi:hypothetical protein
MLQPPGRTERLARRLRFAITDIRNGEDVKELTGQPRPRPQQERMEEIRAIAACAGIDEGGRGPAAVRGSKFRCRYKGGGSSPSLLHRCRRVRIELPYDLVACRSPVGGVGVERGKAQTHEW